MPVVNKGVNILDRYANAIRNAGKRLDRRQDKAFDARQKVLPNIFDVDKMNAYREADIAENEARDQYRRLRQAQGLERARLLPEEDYSLLKPNTRNGYSTINPAFVDEERFVEFEKKTPDRWFGYGSLTGNPNGNVLTDEQMAEYVRRNPNTSFNGPIPGEREFIPEESYRIDENSPMVRKYMNEREERAWDAFNNGSSPVNPSSRMFLSDEQRVSSDMRARQRFIAQQEWFNKRDYLRSQGYNDGEIRRIIGEQP